MTDLEMWSLVVGFLSPPAISVVQQPRWSPRTRAVVAFALCSVFGAGTAWFTGELTGRSVVSGSLVVLVAAIAAYKGLWGPVGVTAAVESATSRGRHVRGT
jgi:hypothetical protein